VALIDVMSSLPNHITKYVD